MIVLYTILIGMYFIGLFVDWNVLNYIVGTLAVLSCVLSFKGANRLFQAAGIIFLLTGTGLFLFQGRPFYEVPLYMTSNITLLALFFVIPFMNSVIIIGRYDRNVNSLMKMKIDHLGQLYNRTSLATFLLGGFLNVATLPLIENVVKQSLLDKANSLKNRFISEAMLRGYTLALFISPMEVLVILSVDYTETSYLTLLPLLIIFVIIIALTIWLVSSKYKQIELGKEVNKRYITLTKHTIFKITTLLIYLILFTVSIIFINDVTRIGLLQTVGLTIVPYSLIWAASIRRFKSFIHYVIPFWKQRTLSLNSYMVLFLSVGFFTSNLNDSIFLDYIQQPFKELIHLPLLLFVFIQFLFLFLAMVGFHPIVTMSILGGVLTPLVAEINPISLAIVLISSSLSTVMAGPFNISVSLTGNLLNVNPYAVSRWNLLFALFFSSIGTGMAMVILQLG
ncbi:hypothetical protein [Metabacillus arenae]|uniref:Uncharacterized protein n=1 Tax=Metabacillus arenae TaxID=2771434 RepID=A0A926S325_9BACI|nr:hypothetical protein [Metabacillus arenae]MBD1382549.1 hypothetical protein [Metabacillus arenae]